MLFTFSAILLDVWHSYFKYNCDYHCDVHICLFLVVAKFFVDMLRIHTSNRALVSAVSVSGLAEII